MKNQQSNIVMFCGSRSDFDEERARAIIMFKLRFLDISIVVHGGAKGVDSLVDECAKKEGIEIVVFKPEYVFYGKRAPLIRNKKMVDFSDRVVALWNYKSHGTKYVIDYCNRKGVPIEVVRI